MLKNLEIDRVLDEIGRGNRDAFRLVVGLGRRGIWIISGAGSGSCGSGGVELPPKSAGEVRTGRFPTTARGQLDFDGGTSPRARAGWTFPHAEHTSDWISIMLIPPR